MFDHFRIAIAKRLSDALPGLTVEKAYEGVDYGKKGVDFTVALPRFRLGGKVDEHAKKVVEAVSCHGFKLPSYSLLMACASSHQTNT